MMYSGGLAHISAEAIVPEQLTHYVRAVSGRRALPCGGFVAYIHEGHAVLVAYPNALSLPEQGGEAAGTWPGDAEHAAPPFSLAAALDELRLHCFSVTVLAPFKPREAPAALADVRDCYWQLSLPPTAPGQKLRNMLRRASREVTVREEGWTLEHQALVARYLAARPLGAGVRAIYAALPAYAALAGDTASGVNVRLFSARAANGALAGFAVGDYTALRTAFYMFAFRAEHAPPGTSDLLLRHIVEQAWALGHERLNLGLAINDGIVFFKRKWGATPFAPYIETSWELNTPLPVRTTLFSRLFGRNQGT